MIYRSATLGCKVNQFETQAMEHILSQRGHTQAGEGEAADAVIINTCAVTAESGRKSRQAIRRLRDENPEAVLAVCGCYSQSSPKDARELDADLIFGSGEREKLVSELERLVLEKAGTVCEHVDDPFKRKGFEMLPPGSVAGRTRAMIKIQDGCVNFCTYCIIPYLRGGIRSLPVDKAVEQAKELLSDGFGEIVLTGIEIASYGRDLKNGEGLINIIEAVSAAVPDVRLRLGSLEPTIITREFVSRLSARANVCDHFHLSLQSGCDDTLRRMNRKYDTNAFYEAVTILRELFPECGITADLIVGFPGESDIDFAETLEFIKKCRFSSMHIFPYSIRPGTKAADMDGQITNAVKSSRARIAGALADEMEREYLNSFIGKKLDVLFEAQKGELDVGHGKNYVQAAVPADGLHGLVKSVEIEGVSGKMLVGVVR